VIEPIHITALEMAQRFVGLTEIPGRVDNPQILAMLRLDAEWPKNDEVPWCSAFLNYICWLLRLPRSKSLLARSWLSVGIPQTIDTAEPGFDTVILKRSGGRQPGPSDLTAPGHVGLFAGLEGGKVLIVGGNQSDQVSTSPYYITRILGIRRLKS